MSKSTNSKNKSAHDNSEKSPTAPKPKPKSKYVQPSPARETIESLVVAFILAFLFRTFEAEAFVIPTGSMAETLNGRHKEIDCEQCQWHYHIGASQEVNGDSEALIPSARIESSVCPNCRYVNAVKDTPVFHGDRILVNKFPYEISDPDRWDVVVFKNPEEPMRNFIKRLVGLPNEYLMIDGGDVYARKNETDEWQILRKDDPNKQLSLQMIVYDNDHPEKLLLEKGWPERWQAVKHDHSEETASGLVIDSSGWKSDTETRVYSITRNESSSDARWLRYRHFVPDEEAWGAVMNDPALPFEKEPAPKLISDFCGYNETQSQRAYGGGSTGNYWVGDLTFSCSVDVTDVGEQGELLLELTEGIRDYQCRFDLQSGTVSLEYYDHALDQQKALDEVQTSFQGAGSHTLIFSNVDHRLNLWIDGKLIPFPSNGEYEAPATSLPTNHDLSPVGISVKDAELTVAHLKVTRDIFYRAEQSIRVQMERMERLTRDRDFGEDFDFSERISRSDLMFALDEPEKYGDLYLKHEHSVEFPQLKDDEFFVLGDNSPASLDSRLWDDTHAVPRHAMLGKAFFIYWPHGVPFMNGGEGYPITYHKQFDRDPRGGNADDRYPKMRFPFYPNIPRMERIR